MSSDCLVIIRRLSWPSLAYVCTNVFQSPINVFCFFLLCHGHAAVQRQKTVSNYLQSKQILPFSFAELCTLPCIFEHAFYCDLRVINCFLALSFSFDYAIFAHRASS